MKHKLLNNGSLLVDTSSISKKMKIECIASNGFGDPLVKEVFVSITGNVDFRAFIIFETSSEGYSRMKEHTGWSFVLVYAHVLYHGFS